MIDEVKLRKKKDKEINYMLSESLDHLGAHARACDPVIQCRLVMRCPICFVKLIKILFDFLHVHVHIKHGIVSLLVGDIMCTRSSNTYTLPLKN
jgi:hypothetical protein